MNYFVPNFGKDHDIKRTHESLEWAEKDLKHKWVFKGYPDKKKDHPKDYPVPNFGVDEDIAWTQKNIEDASKNLGHKWEPVQDDNGVWLVPGAADNKSYSYKSLAQLDAKISKSDETLVQTESDPICASAFDCQGLNKKTHPMNYFVPNFGVDHQILATNESLDWAEKKVGHKWEVTKEQLKKPEQVLYDTEDNKKLDPSIRESLASLKQEEKVHGVWNLPKEDE